MEKAQVFVQIQKFLYCKQRNMYTQKLHIESNITENLQMIQKEQNIRKQQDKYSLRDILRRF